MRLSAIFSICSSTTTELPSSVVSESGALIPSNRATGPEGATGDDGVVRVEVLEPGATGDQGRLRLRVTDLAGRPLTLGSYLGASAHLTGFAVGEGGFVHVHPYGAPEVTDDGTVLTFHTTFTDAGTFRMFVQVRVDGLLHQVALTTNVTSDSDGATG